MKIGKKCKNGLRHIFLGLCRSAKSEQKVTLERSMNSSGSNCIEASFEKNYTKTEKSRKEELNLRTSQENISMPKKKKNQAQDFIENSSKKSKLKLFGKGDLDVTDNPKMKNLKKSTSLGSRDEFYMPQTPSDHLLNSPTADKGKPLNPAVRRTTETHQRTDSGVSVKSDIICACGRKKVVKSTSSQGVNNKTMPKLKKSQSFSEESQRFTDFTIPSRSCKVSKKGLNIPIEPIIVNKTKSKKVRPLAV